MTSLLLINRIYCILYDTSSSLALRRGSLNIASLDVLKRICNCFINR